MQRDEAVAAEVTVAVAADSTAVVEEDSTVVEEDSTAGVGAFVAAGRISVAAAPILAVGILLAHAAAGILLARAVAHTSPAAVDGTSAAGLRFHTRPVAGRRLSRVPPAAAVSATVTRL